MVMSRYEFLSRAHEIVRPRIYLEVGVQTGASLALAEAAELAIGVDPHPVMTRENVRPNQDITAWTSDYFFEQGAPALPTWSVGQAAVDFGYIDGSHLFEDALRDFMNLEDHCRMKAVIMLDDVLPYNKAIAARTQPPGDWTGDVWKIAYVLEEHRPDLSLTPVDVAPTGLLMVCGLHPGDDVLRDSYDKIVEEWRDLERVPPQVLDRTQAVGADLALDILRGSRG